MARARACGTPTGAEYLDFLAGISVCNAGHCHPRVVAAVQEQAAELMHVSNLYFNRPMVALAERLADRSLGGRVFFTNSGAEANEAAIKLVRKARRGGELVVLHHGVPRAHLRRALGHAAGEQAGAVRPAGAGLPRGRRRPRGDRRGGRTRARRRCCWSRSRASRACASCPTRCSAPRARRATASGAALVFDEVQTGMGRTGTLWAYEQSGVVPDAMTVAKALGGGLPIGALITGERLADVLEPGDHGSTFAGGPVVAAAAHAALDVLDDPALLARVRELGERLAEGLRELPARAAVRAPRADGRRRPRPCRRPRWRAGRCWSSA